MRACVGAFAWSSVAAAHDGPVDAQLLMAEVLEAKQRQEASQHAQPGSTEAGRSGFLRLACCMLMVW